MNRIGNLVTICVVAAIIGAVMVYRANIVVEQQGSASPDNASSSTSAEPSNVLEISSQARKNLNVVTMPARPQNYWRSVAIPGAIADRPGMSDRAVTSPAVGVVTAIHAFPGDTLPSGNPLITLRLFSEYLQNTQTALFKASQEMAIIQEQIDRLSSLVSSGAVSQTRLIELKADMSRQRASIQSARQDLLTRGLLPEQIERVERNGEFVSTIDIAVPQILNRSIDDPNSTDLDLQQTNSGAETRYEVQELSVEMGQQVQAGQLLAKLANHQSLYIVGHAFKKEAAFLEASVKEHRPVKIEFADDNEKTWGDINQTFHIRYLANSIDPNSRTFDFFVPLINQSHAYEKDGTRFFVWRFRPGQRVRIHVPVEMFENVFVLPSEAVVRQGPEAYVFRQNGDLFKRFSVHVVHEDRLETVIANDGSIPNGSYLAQNAAASLNRVLKAQAASGVQAGFHIHDDGTVHAAH